MPRLLDLAQLLSSSGLAQPGACFFLVEELMDVSLIDGCGDLFSFLEASLAGTGSKAVQTVVLRTCNALLRRVSKVGAAGGGGAVQWGCCWHMSPSREPDVCSCGMGGTARMDPPCRAVFMSCCASLPVHSPEDPVHRLRPSPH